MMDKKNKVIMISGISVASLAMLAAIISAFHKPEAPNPNQLGSRTKVSYMASKQFANLSDKGKTAYIKKLGRSSMKEYGKLNTNERNAVIKNTTKVKIEMMKGRLNKFFAMSKEEQNKHLDEQIAKWEKAKERWKQKASQNKGSNNKRNNAGINKMRQNFIENTDSTTRAQMMEYFKRVKERSSQNKGK
jgi:uncharacterized protein YdaU (DUF1376 family)